MRIIGSAVILVALAACETEQTIVYRPDTPASTRSRDLLACELMAAQQVPVNTQIRTNPVYVSPANIQCTSYGYSTSCYDYGSQVSGGGVYSVDANVGLRARVRAQCLADRGYSAVTLPICTSQTSNQSAYNMSTTALPHPSAISCVRGDSFIPI